MDPANEPPTPTNYISYQCPIKRIPQIGHYDFTTKEIHRLSFSSGAPISTLYQVIEAGASNIRTHEGRTIRSSPKILPPLPNRDVLCVGKNYAEHAREFNSSGFDSSDKVDQPTHPVIFTKRFTSIIGDGDEIWPHPEFSQTVDYEGEIGVIIGKMGYRIKEEEAMEYVWGYTIINDVTARERQRDHKQFYIGKSADTFCPMGPVAVRKEHLSDVLRVQTHVNGELRQDATTDDLIFSISYLIKTMSEGQTLMPGDVLATGTPAGVGIGLKPPIYLTPGDTISISIPGLGTLTNRIASPSTTAKPIPHPPQPIPHFPPTTFSKIPNPSLLLPINSSSLYHHTIGPEDAPPLLFIHGLGGTTESFTPLIHTLRLQKTYSCHLFDLEGHGLSPTHPLSTPTIPSYTADLTALISDRIPTPLTLVATAPLGCLIALSYALAHPSEVKKLILIGPPRTIPLSADYRETIDAMGDTARRHGMAILLELSDSTGLHTNHALFDDPRNSLGLAARRLSLLGQDPEGYAKGCSALAGFTEALDVGGVEAEVCVVTDTKDRGVWEEYVGAGSGAVVVQGVEGVEEWCGFEKLEEVARVVGGWLVEGSD